jgi:GNAT superfamily N-acetyltransferase
VLPEQPQRNASDAKQAGKPVYDRSQACDAGRETAEYAAVRGDGMASILGFALSDGLHVSATTDPASPLLTRFFEGYDRAFVLPDEREELDGFVACLALNQTHRHAFGRTHSELVAVIEDDAGTLLAGANFLATAIARGAGVPSAAIALNYVYVEEAARGRGLLRKALEAVRLLAASALGLDPEAGTPAIFIEQNDPLRMTAEQYAADTAHSGIDQIDRLAIWARMGARIVDFPYIQPPLSAQQNPDDSLVYAAVTYPGEAVDAGLLHDHLQSFFSISVLKGHAEPPGGVATSQLQALIDGPRHVPLLAMEPALVRLRAKDAGNHGSLRDLAREAAGNGDAG